MAKWLATAVLIIRILVAIGATQARTPDDVSQVVVSPTPLRVIISTSTPLPTSGVPPTEVPPSFTPTEEGPAQLEVSADSSEVNVRAEPDIEADILGVIRTGERFTVTGKYFRWYQIRFDPSPNRTAYVYEELVAIVEGNPANIPDLTESLLPTQDTSFLVATETAAAIALTPGFELTITADARVIEAPSGQNSAAAEVTDEVGNRIILPTYTYPPNVAAQAPTSAPVEAAEPTADPSRISLRVDEGIAPIVPIVVLATLGIVGLLITTLLRR